MPLGGAPLVDRLGAWLALTILGAATATGAPVEDGLFELIEIVPGVHAVLPDPVGANAAILINDRDVVVVDSHSSPAAARALLPRIRELTDRPLRLLVNTHWHTDHVLGNRAYRDAAPGPFDIVAHATTRRDIPALGPSLLDATERFGRRSLEEGRDRLASLPAPERTRLARFLDDYAECLDRLSEDDFALPTWTFEERLTLHRGEREIRLVHLGPAHTAGDVVVVLPRERVAITGDLLTAPRLYASPSSDLPGWLRALRYLDQLDLEVFIPGHGPLLRGEEHLHRMIGLLEALVEAVEDDGAPAVPLVQERARAYRPPELTEDEWSAYVGEMLAIARLGARRENGDDRDR